MRRPGPPAGLAVSGEFLADVAATAGAWALGLAIAVAVAVPAGVVLGSLPGVRAATRAMVEFLRPIPSVALIVLVGLILGPGLRMNVTLIVYAAIWPVLLNTIYGLDDGRISGNGIGAFIAEANTGAGNTSLVLAAALWAGLLGLAANTVWCGASAGVLRWHHAYPPGPA